MKFGYGGLGKNVGWGWVLLNQPLSKVFWGLRGRKRQGTGENCVMRRFKICTLHQILMEWSNQLELKWTRLVLLSGRTEIRTDFS